MSSQSGLERNSGSGEALEHLDELMGLYGDEKQYGKMKNANAEVDAGKSDPYSCGGVSEHVGTEASEISYRKGVM